MKRLAFVGAAGLLLAACGSEEPEDGSTTAASSVGMASESGTGGASASGDASSSGESAASDDSSESSSSGGVSVDYETEIQPIWNGSCTCHLMGASGTMSAPFLTLNPGMSYAQLVDVPSEQAPLDRIEPGSPEDSYLWLKMTNAHASVGSGARMPQIGAIGDVQLQTIEAWILGGASEE